MSTPTTSPPLDAEAAAPSVTPPTEPAPPTVGDHRSRPSRIMRRLGLIAVAVAVIAVLLAGWWLTGLRSPLPVSEVRVVGASPDLEPVVAQLADIPAGTSFAAVDGDAVVAAVTVIDGITDADLAWAWPGVLEIRVQEQLPFAIIRAPRAAGKFAVLDRNADVIRTTATRPQDLPLISGASGEARGAVLATIEVLPDDLAAQVREYVAVRPDSVRLLLRGGSVVDWGQATRPGLKSQVLRQLLEIDAKRYDVSVPQRPALTGLTEG